MDAYRNTRRQSGVDYPRPETDLAEWTSKIKAMQRQVDADEEAEQRRLEEEIAAARQARKRRSRGSRPPDSADLSRAAEELNLSSSPSDRFSEDKPKDATERYGHQSEALRKIMGQNAVYVPGSPGGRSEGVSLASFIGGRASGPRLNKHAAQQDAHDPTQYNQPDTSAPHPIFGKGGIAMPGMVSKTSLGGGQPRSGTPSQDNRKAISDLRAVASALSSSSRPTEEPAKSNYLRQPDEVRRKSTSPTPREIVGTEAAERYRPSASPTPSSTLRGQKSFDRGNNRSYGTEDAERYRPSASPAPSSTLRPQKSFDGRAYGTEEAERYRPSTSPTPSSSLRPQKSFDGRSYGSEAARSSTSPTPRSTLKSQKSFERSYGRSSGTEAAERYRSFPSSATPPSTTKRTERSVSPQKTGNTYSSVNAAKSSPDLRKQKSYTRFDERPVSPQKTGGRERAISTPKPPASESVRAPDTSTPAKHWTPPTTTSRPISYLSSTQGQAPSRERTISTPNYLPKGPITMQPTGKSSVIATVSLAKPIQPEPRTPSNGPKISPSVAPSPAFQKVALPKDVTPSISRLQGRGFVQNMVKASLTLESHSAPNSTTASPAEKPRPTPVKKGSVLDRWQPQNQATPPSPVSPVKSAFNTTPIRRAATTEPQPLGRPTQNAPHQASPYLRPASARPPSAPPAEEPLSPRSTARMMDMMAPGRNMGSATTMFVEKTTVDELGVKRPPSRGSSRGSMVQARAAALDSNSNSANHHSRTSELPAPTGKPLIHPTKGRAKRPRKASANQQARKVEPVLLETKQIVEEPVPAAVEEKAQAAAPRVSQPLTRSDSKIGRLAEQWKGAGPITPKVVSPSPSSSAETRQEPKQYAGIRHALPGMAKEPRKADAVPRSTTPKGPEPFGRLPPINVASSPPSDYKPYHTPPSPGLQPRIPSTGSRATVMEVAQALVEHAVAENASVVPTIASPRPAEERAVAEKPEQLRSPTLRHNFTPASVEKRKSSYDSFATLPPLKEEATPAPSPANTLTRSIGRAAGSGLMQPITESIHAQTKATVKNGDDSGIVRLVHDNTPIPTVDLSIMFNRPVVVSPVPVDAKTISVEVMSIVGSNSTTLTKDTSVFFESEALAIIHRFKDASSGLVDTYVWGWLGKKSQFGEAEEKKLHELARRYGTMPVIVRQCAEPAHLVKLLGGRLAVRQGTRAYWTADNTAMHIVRAVGDVIFIDELDLNVKHLCSGFSYCLSILGTVYVWYGTGSLDKEREAALQYAGTICGESEIVELTQGENDDNEMFWMILGQEAFADADYWRWRRKATFDVRPTVWRVDAKKRTNQLSAVEFYSDEANPCHSIYLVNCIWELFVIVGPNARGNRQDIRLALDIANRYTKQIAAQRPYTPNVHILVLPSQIPLDLKMHVRDMDETVLNLGNIPDHMNLVSSAEAVEQLAKTSWSHKELKDTTMLPLGIESNVTARSISA
ncbi:hypothetical protein D9611_003938 [Ephemerocybe angulata]|uniref:Gelsolin n=1 Tax=Ephemerocybe angulata TaxID=980116 RepID=A0A8H5EY80_9AGAR|nr:hypothetical protein D9611_003938 [Tulosesus angulatus]